MRDDNQWFIEIDGKIHCNPFYAINMFEQKVVDETKQFLPMLTMVSKGIFIHSHYYNGHRCDINLNKVCDKISTHDIMHSKDLFNIYGNLKENNMIELHNNTYILTEKGSAIFRRIKERENAS